MALVEKRGLVNIDSDSEDLVKSNPKIHYVVLSDSSDDDDDEDEDEDEDENDIEFEEQSSAQRTHAAWIRRLQSRTSSPRNLSSAQDQSFQTTTSIGLNQQLRTTPSRPDAIASLTRAVWPMQNRLNSTSPQAEIGNLLLTRDKTKISQETLSTQAAETIYPGITSNLRPIDINEDEYVLSLLNDFYPEYESIGKPRLQKYPEADEMSVRSKEGHREVVALHNFDEALGIVLQVLPDICTEFVRQKYDERRGKSADVDADSLLADILSEKSYPKQKLPKKRKRRDGEVEEEDEILNSVVTQGQITNA